MNAVTPDFYYPPVTLYAVEDEKFVKCEVVSFLIKGELYKRVTRIADQAYQILRTDQHYTEPLFSFEKDHWQISHIYISDKWQLKLGQEGADHRLA